jgi:YHS domain-containing protein
MSPTVDTAAVVLDPVCGMDATPMGPYLLHDGVMYRFCEDACAEIFAADPSRWAPPFRLTPPEHTGPPVRGAVIVAEG